MTGIPLGGVPFRQLPSCPPASDPVFEAHTPPRTSPACGSLDGGPGRVGWACLGCSSDPAAHAKCPPRPQELKLTAVLSLFITGSAG